MSTKVEFAMEVLKEITDLTKKRSSFKGRITIFSSYLNSLNLSSLTTKDISELQLRIRKLESLYAQFDELQTRLECLSDNLEAQMAHREDFESKYYKIVCQAQELVDSHKQPLSAAPSQCSSRSGNKPVKLPTIQLPKFSGSYSNWLEFRDTFDSLIHSNEDIDVVNKYHYLRASLEGSAAVVIQSIQFSAANYNIAWTLLCDRFDNKRLLIQNHVTELFNIEPIARESSISLKRLLDQFNKNIRALESLGEPTHHWDTLLIHILTHKLDNKTFREWEEFKGRLNKQESIIIKHFIEFIKVRTDLLETIELSRYTEHNNITSNSKPTKYKAMVSLDNNNTSLSSSSTSSCPKCNGDHKLNHCPQFLSLSNEARLQILPSFKICYNCFRSGHYANKCRKSGCKLCKRRHNTLIHVANSKQTSVVHSGRADSSALPATIDTNHSLSLSASVAASGNPRHAHRVDVLLSTVLIKLYDSHNREHIARALLDSGSTSCIMTEDLFCRLDLPCIRIDQSILGINNVMSHISKMCHVPMKSLDETFTTNLRCFVLPSIASDLPRSSVDLLNLNIPSYVCLADPNFHTPASVDMIIGADIFWDILGSQKIILGTGKPILQETRLGWIVSGPIYSNTANSVICNYVHVDTSTDNSDAQIQQQLSRFSSLEYVNDCSTYSPEHTLCEEHFINHTERLSDGHFCVRIPLKNSPSILGESLHRAKQCFLSLERRLMGQPRLRQLYREFMCEYKALGHMSDCELSSKTNANFISHHSVLRKSSVAIKLRAIFNASSLTTTGVTLNNIQMVGPVVQDDLLSKKMYRQILVHPDDRYLQRIIWRDDPKISIKAFQLNTITYGTVSAPLLATRCLKQLSLECKDKKVAEIILHDYYVVDSASGGDDFSEVKVLGNKLTSILASACLLALRKWKSNDLRLVSNSYQYPFVSNISSDEHSRTLGVGWQTVSDKWYFSTNTHSDITCISSTKRYYFERRY